LRFWERQKNFNSKKNLLKPATSQHHEMEIGKGKRGEIEGFLRSRENLLAVNSSGRARKDQNPERIFEP